MRALLTVIVALGLVACDPQPTAVEVPSFEVTRADLQAGIALHEGWNAGMERAIRETRRIVRTEATGLGVFDDRAMLGLIEPDLDENYVLVCLAEDDGTDMRLRKVPYYKIGLLAGDGPRWVELRVCFETEGMQPDGSQVVDTTCDGWSGADFYSLAWHPKPGAADPREGVLRVGTSAVTPKDATDGTRTAGVFGADPTRNIWPTNGTDVVHEGNRSAVVGLGNSTYDGAVADCRDLPEPVLE